MLFGFKDNKCKQEVYSKGEVDSKYLLQDNFTTIRGGYTYTCEAEDSGSSYDVSTNSNIQYPNGFTKDNCVIVSFDYCINDETLYSTPTTFSNKWFNSSSTNLVFEKFKYTMLDESISFDFEPKITNTSYTIKGNYRLVLMKLPEVDISGYQLGDVNMDGAITEDDLTLMNQYLEGTATLTDKQIKLADVNKDGVINSGDLLKMQKYLMGEIDSF